MLGGSVAPGAGVTHAGSCWEVPSFTRCIVLTVVITPGQEAEGMSWPRPCRQEGSSAHGPQPRTPTRAPVSDLPWD